MFNKGSLEDQQFFPRLLFLIGSVAFCALLAGVLIYSLFFISTTLFHADIYSISQNIAYLKGIQLLSTIAMFLIPALLLAYVSSWNPFGYLFADRGASVKIIAIAILTIVVMQPFMNLTGDWFSNWSLPSSLSGIEKWLKTEEQQNNDLVQRFLNVHSLGGLMFNILVVAIVPAVGEEFFFRGALQRLLSDKMNIHLAIWFTALIFSAVHMDVSGLLPRMCLGAFFGYLVYWSKSIWLSVIAHFINNFWGVLSAYLVYNQCIDKNIDHLGTGSTEWVSWVGLLLFGCLLFWLFTKRLANNNMIGNNF